MSSRGGLERDADRQALSRPQLVQLGATFFVRGLNVVLLLYSTKCDMSLLEKPLRSPALNAVGEATDGQN